MTIKSIPSLWPLLLVPAFLLLNAANEYFGDLDLRFYLRMGGYLLMLVVLTALLNAIILRNNEQVLVFSFLTLLYVFFTKNLYTIVETYLSRSVFFLISALLLVSALVIIKRSNSQRLKSFNKGLLFVFSALVIYESGTLVVKKISRKNLSLEFPDKPVLSPWLGPKPNIYLLLFDEYQGNKGLEDLFGYSNSNFFTFLEQEQFKVLKSPRSNYNYTYFSVPSMFAMSYLYYTDGKYDLEYSRVIKSINALHHQNYFTDFLVKNGYEIQNFSLFNFAGIPTPYDFDGLDEDPYAVLFSRTLPGWFKTDLLHGVPSNAIHRIARDLYYQFFHYNRSVLKDTKDAVGRSDSGPVFVYSHFLLPHLPVVTDSSGTMLNISEAADDLQNNRPALKQSYLQYTKYANKVCKEIVNDVIEHDVNAVILVVSDHGLRRLLGSSWVHDIQMAVRLPGRPDPGFYDEMTSVNILRLVLNGIAGQRLVMLPDSVISVK